MKLNADQQSVVEHVKGSISVLAPAGSGKTELLALRVLRALDSGIKPEEILCLTFTNLASRQLRERVGRHAPLQANKIWTGTFHGFCASVLHIEAKHVGLPSDFVIYDEVDCEGLLKNIMQKTGINRIKNPEGHTQNDTYYKPTDILTIFDNAKSRVQRFDLSLHGFNGQGLEGKCMLERGYVEDGMRKLYHIYANRLISRHALDFSDLVYYVRAIFANEDALSEKWSHRFQFIQVDEIQDTHLAEYDVIRTLALARNIAVFGDIDQSIYGWRGATPLQVMNEFKNDFNPKEYTLPLNYRATEYLIRAADSFASCAFAERYTKLIPAKSCPKGKPIQIHFAETERDEGQWIGKRIKEETTISSYTFGEVAVLCRSNKKAQQIGNVLAYLDVPCLTVEQYQYFRRQEIKDAVALLKLLINPYDTSAAQRISLRFIEGVGEVGVKRIIEEGAAVGIRLPDFLREETISYDDPFGHLIHAFNRGRILVFDTETTGLNVASDNIIDLAYCILESGMIAKEWTSFVRSEIAVNQSVHIHGITDEMLAKEGMDPAEALKSMFQDSAKGLIVGHNVVFDLGILQSQAWRIGIAMPRISFADTYELSRRFIKECDSYKLGDLCKTFNLATGTAHHAMGDVQGTVNLLKFLMPMILDAQDKRRTIVAKYKDKFEESATLFSHFRRQAEDIRPYELLREMLETLHIIEYYSNESNRVDNLKRLVSIFKEQDKTEYHPLDALKSLVQFAGLARNLDHLSERENKVIVAPIHQSKGLEFKSVFIAGAVEGFIPHFNSNDLEEEKRLFYVAMTRPKEFLHISGFENYGKYKKEMTPFLNNIDLSFLESA